MNFPKITPILIILALAVLGFGAVIYATRYGIGASPDSVVYIGTAQNLLAGKGLTVPSGALSDQPLTQYPPFYPQVLAGVSLLVGEPYVAARWLAAMIYAANILLVSLILFRLLPEARWMSVAGGAGMLLAPVMLEIHVMAWTEPLFIALGLSCLIALAAYLQEPQGVWLVLAAIFAGLALLTRYAGAAYLATGILGLWILAATTIQKRLRSIFAFTAIAVTPTLILLAYNRLSAGTATNRTLGFHPVTRTQLRQGLTTLSGWLGLPAGLPTWLYLISLAAAGGALLLIFWGVTRAIKLSETRHIDRHSFPPIVLLLGLFGLIYGVFLIVSITFMDANTPMDNRILAPTFIALLVIGCYTAGKAYRQAAWPFPARWAGLIAIGLLLVVYAGMSIPTLGSYRENGIGLSASVWRSSVLLAEVDALPDSVAVYSNLPDAVYLLTGHRAVRLPRSFELSSQQANPDFEAEIAQMGAQVQAGDAVIVFFNQAGRLQNPSEADLAARLPLEIVYGTTEGSIYQIREP